MPREARVEYWKALNDKWYFHHIAANGKNDEPSQGYASRRGVRAAARRRYPDVKLVLLHD